jgi:hypothetical protein
MKGRVLSYKTIGLLFVLLLSCTTIRGAEYRGEQSISPFMRFLRGLFWGGSGTATRFEHRSQGPTYQFSSLAIGSSKTGATLSNEASSQQDIWTGYGSSLATSVSVSRIKTANSKSFNRLANSNGAASLRQTDGYVRALSSSAATSSTLSSTSSSSSSSTSDAASVSMPSMMTMQRASSQFTMTTLASSVNGGSQPQTDTDGFGTNGSGAAEPAIQTPVGDGSWVLLFLLSLYVYLRRKRFFVRFFPV